MADGKQVNFTPNPDADRALMEMMARKVNDPILKDLLERDDIKSNRLINLSVVGWNEFEKAIEKIKIERPGNTKLYSRTLLRYLRSGWLKSKGTPWKEVFEETKLDIDADQAKEILTQVFARITELSKRNEVEQVRVIEG
ncbi:MAG: hypothetical protein KGN01_06455 [Patescibacteria group bacterium]|nr:hypothetical protein [Patescibacteria group bacterium]